MKSEWAVDESYRTQQGDSCEGQGAGPVLDVKEWQLENLSCHHLSDPTNLPHIIKVGYGSSGEARLKAIQ